MECENDIKEDNLVELIKNKNEFQKYFDGKEVIKKFMLKINLSKILSIKFFSIFFL